MVNVYMKQTEGFITEGKEHLVCKLKEKDLWPQAVTPLLKHSIKLSTIANGYNTSYCFTVI